MSESRRKIKRERIRSIFIQSAKELIFENGVEEISVRTVAEVSGYSYASIYNHFKDLNDLLYAVKLEVICDVKKYMSESNPDILYTLQDIKRINRMHIEYYVSNPNVFKFLYSYNITQPKDKLEYLKDIEESWKSIYQGFVENGVLSQVHLEVVSKAIIYSIHGILLLHFSNRNLSVEDLCIDLDRITEFVLRG